MTEPKEQPPSSDTTPSPPSGSPPAPRETELPGSPNSRSNPAGGFGSPPPLLDEVHLRSNRRNWILPVFLFLVTCASTFWAGAANWNPIGFSQNDDIFRRILLQNGMQGFIYMSCVLAILFAHEMGHFIATIIHRVPASFPFFIPFPFTPMGTMGAVIAMDGRKANRRQIFDIGLAGPLAGLVVAIPVLIYGVARLKIQKYTGLTGVTEYDCPLFVEWLISVIHPNVGYVDSIPSFQLNPFYMAGWVGLLITGLNMLPVSQLDGGHVIYALFGKRAHWVARGFILFVIAYIVLADAFIWSVMTILVILMGTDHPPTRDDRVSLGWWRKTLGYASLTIPILCFPAQGIKLPDF